MDRWCQNKKCCLKKNQGQIRGKKGFKYYQSYKATTYYNNLFCSQRCQDQFLNDNWQAVLNAIGEIGKQTLPLDDAWYVDWSWGTYRPNHETGRGEHINSGYYLICLLYTSDAADDSLRVDLGGRRIIKKKDTTQMSE